VKLTAEIFDASRCVAYYRVSTHQQGLSGLGLEAQRETVRRFLSGGKWELLAEFTEVESGRRRARPELEKAMATAKARKATLAIAKLDRLARNVHFISGLLESRVRFVCCDVPQADRTMLQMLAVFGEHEARMISERTKAALAAAQARGVKLGNPRIRDLNRVPARKAREFAERMRGTLEAMRAARLTHRAMVAELNKMGVTTPRGGTWGLAQLQRVLNRLGLRARASARSATSGRAK
jgi:DNA invertase Pin-like site-specific DNA recombinase